MAASVVIGEVEDYKLESCQICLKDKNIVAFSQDEKRLQYN